MIYVRQAQQDDIESICDLDHVVRIGGERRGFIEKSVRTGAAWVAVFESKIAGYAVLEQSFFSRGFLSMLYVHKDHRRTGIGAALVHRVESLCQTERLFTSTNEANVPMQGLLAKLGYVQSGVINHLDPADPEIIYSKKLR